MHKHFYKTWTYGIKNAIKKLCKYWKNSMMTGKPFNLEWKLYYDMHIHSICSGNIKCRCVMLLVTSA